MKMQFLIPIFVLFNIIGWGLFYVASSHESKSLPLQPSAPSYSSTNLKTNISPLAAEIKKTFSVPVSQGKNIVAARPTENKNPSWINNEIKLIKPQASNLNINVLKASLTAFQHAQQLGVVNKPLLTIIDYSKPSTEKRLWVVDLNKQKILFNTLVAHGKNSGTVNSFSFSNRPSSLKSSIGVFVTTDIYSGKHGNSLHVQGLEHGVNDNAYDRSIVFHGAQYVSPSIARSGKLGRSWGCMAVSQDIIQPLINTIKNKSLVVAYYPDQKWLNTSSYLA